MLAAWRSQLQPHPDPALDRAWKITQVSVLLLPFSPLLGVAGCLIGTILVWRSRYPTMRQQPVYQGLAVLSGLLVLSAIASPHPLDASLGLFHFLPYFFGFAGLCELLATPAQLRRLAWLLVLPAIAVCGIGFGQLLLGWLGYPNVIHLQILWIVLDWQIDPQGTPPGRMSANFFYANVLANYLIVTLVLALGLAIAAGWQRHRRAQGITAIAVLLNSLALMLTHSRNGWAIAAGACGVYALYLGRRLWVAAVLALVGVVFAAAFAPPPLQTGLRAIVPRFIWARLTDELYPDRPLPTLRSTQWQFALELTQQRPWLGWGLRNFTPLYLEHTSYVMGHPHNLLLMLLCETGIPATLLLVGLVGWIVVQALRQIPALPSDDPSDRLISFSFVTAFLSNTVFNLFDVTLFDARINLLGWLLLAALGGLAQSAPLARGLDSPGWHPDAGD